MSTIVLAYSGGFASSNAVHWLTETYGADVVTVTLDVGQGDELGALRARALSCGAVRAHAIDAREEFVREYLLPSLRSRPVERGTGHRRVHAPADRAEAAGGRAHRGCLHRRTRVARRIARCGAFARSILASRSLRRRALWTMDATQLSDYARMHGVPPRPASEPQCRIDQSLWGRMISFRDLDGRPSEAHLKPLSASNEAAQIDLQFEGGVPVSINDVPMPPVELVESLALIAGQHGVGRRREHQQRAHGRLRRAGGHGAAYGTRGAGRSLRRGASVSSQWWLHGCRSQHRSW